MSDKAKYDEIRSIVQQAYENDKDSFDEELCKIAWNDDWILQKYLDRKRNVKEAAEMLINTLKYGHEYRISKLNDQHFPAEYFKMSLVFDYLKDRQGNYVVYIRHQFYRKIKELDMIYRKFLLYQIYKMDSTHRAVGIIVDLTGVGLDNTDMDFARWGMKIFGDCCPPTLNYMLLYNLPRIMVHAWYFIKRWLPEDLAHVMKFCNGDEILDYVAPENLPKFLNGKAQVNHYRVPNGCKSIEEYGKENNFPEKSIEKIKKMWKPYLAKCENEMKNYGN